MKTENNEIKLIRKNKAMTKGYNIEHKPTLWTGVGS